MEVDVEPFEMVARPFCWVAEFDCLLGGKKGLRWRGRGGLF